MASPNLSAIVSTTLRNRTAKLHDNVSENVALLKRLKSKGKLKLVGGGVDINEPLAYQENSTYKRYSGYETLNVSPSDVISSATYSWRQAAIAVTISGLEQLQNSGKEQFLNLLESRIEVAENTFSNNISADVYSDGTSDGGKQIDGLQAIIADSPATGTVGGINAATYSWWRNYAFDATTDGGTAATSSNIQSYMNDVFVNITRGADKPDLVTADNNYFTLYLESLQAIQRIQSDEFGQAGFTSLKYMNADVLLDGGYGGDAPTNHMYFVNTDYLKFVSHRDRNMTVIGDDRDPVNQDAIVRLIGWAGNLCCSNRFVQGVLKD